jgi:Icc-related predicted phosphoesterase
LSPEYSKFRPRDARFFHQQSRPWLEAQVARNRGRPTVIVTHHAPSPQSLKPQQRNRPINPAYASNLEGFVAASGVALWIHGHIHHCSDYRIGQTRVLANTRGYHPDQPVLEFNPGLVVEI